MPRKSDVVSSGPGSTNMHSNPCSCQMKPLLCTTKKEKKKYITLSPGCIVIAINKLLVNPKHSLCDDSLLFPINSFVSKQQIIPRNSWSVNTHSTLNCPMQPLFSPYDRLIGISSNSGLSQASLFSIFHNLPK